MIGKTNMDEFAMGSSTENSAYGPTRNPWDPDRVPGGSSGGSAAAVAAGLAPWALGSDTGGSIKQPAALCGVVGLRPTYGTVSRSGIVAFASSLDQIGPITKTVADCAFLYSVIAGRDPYDTTTVELPEPVEIPEAEDLKGLRIGVPKELNEAEGIEPGVSEAVNAAIELCRELGAEVGETTLPRSVEYGLPCYYLIAPSEASSNLARYDGVRYGLRVTDGDVRELYMRTRDAGFGDEPKRRIMLGTYALSAGYYDAYYGQAQKVRTIIRDEFRAALEQFDLLVSPTSPTVAFPLGAKTDNPLAMYLSDVLAIPPNMAGLPGLSIPCGLSEGLPVGLQLIGPQFSENLLFRAGHALEQALDVRLRPAEARRELGTGHRPRDPRPPEDADEDVLPLRARVLRARELAHVPRLPRAPGHAPRAEPARDRDDDPARPRARLRHRRPRRLPPQALLLSRPAEGLPDLPVRRAALRRRGVHAADRRRRRRRRASSAPTSRRTRPRTCTWAAPRAASPAPTGRSSTSTAPGRRSSRSSPGPDLHSSEHAKRFLQLLRQTVVELGISDAEMEKGSLRFDVNVSVRPEGSDELRTRTELKNMNSFNFAAKGIEREIQRQIQIYESGGEVEQETMHFDPGNESAPPLRSKEEAQDYRYLPEPDLVPLEPPRDLVERACGRSCPSYRARGSTGSARRSASSSRRGSSSAAATASSSRSPVTGRRSRTSS